MLNSEAKLKRRGHSLVELLVAISIIGLLLAILIPAVQSARATARRTECLNKVKQIGIALQNYESQNGHFPSGRDEELLAWSVSILPFTDQAAWYQRSQEAFEKNPSPFGPFHPGDAVIPGYVCPTDSRIHGPNFASSSGRLTAHTSFIGISGLDHTRDSGIMYSLSQTRVSGVPDGLSNTLIVGERPPSKDFNFGWWYTGLGQDDTGNVDMFMGVREAVAANSTVPFYDPTCMGTFAYGPGNLENYCDVMHFWSLHHGGANFVFADGSARLITYDIDPGVLSAIATRHGGEIEGIAPR